MSKHLPKSESFFMLTPNVRDKLLEAKLTAAEWRIWCYLVSLDPFGSRGAKFSPSELMLKCSVKKSTYFAAKAKFQKLGLFDFRDGVTKVFNLQGHFNHCEHRDYSQQPELIESKISDYSQQQEFIESKISDYSQQQEFIESKISDYSQQQELIESKISESNSKISESESEISELESKISESRTPKPLKDEDSGSLKTIKTIKTNQTEGVVEKISEETAPPPPAPQVKSQNQKSSPANVTNSGSSFTHISNTLASSPKPQQRTNSAPSENNSQIPQDLRNKLEELEIPLDGRVRKAIASHHISQAYGAVAHIERTWETINNPRGVFLFQISRQPVEPMGARLPVKTAADDLTLEYLKRIYPNNWQDAAAHFGLEVVV